MAEDKILVTMENGIKRIAFNRPDRRNAVDAESSRRLRDAIRECEHDESRVIILTGTGEAFCSGADLQVRSAEETRRYDVTAALRETTNATILAMRKLPKPIIAGVHGPAVGVGCNYALACDVRIASDQARFGQVFIRVGLMPDGGGTYFLPKLVGYAKAFELMTTGEIIDAQQALRLGLVNKIVGAARLDAAVNEFALKLLSAPALPLRRIKEALGRAELPPLAEALEFEAVHQQECFHSEDFVEGVRAFREKRPPRFKK